MKSFKTVWQTINEKNIDPTFNGLDWPEVHDRYKFQISATQNEAEYYLLINKMLFELNVSHIGVVPPGDLGQIDPILSAEGSIGIDVRMIKDNAVITSVKSGSNSDQAGLRSGYIIKSIDGINIDKITDLKHIDDIKVQDIEKRKRLKGPKILTPPYNERNRKRNITDAILEKIYGSPDSLVLIEYVDEKGDSFLKKIVRAQRKGMMKFDDELPPFFVEFESKLLENNIGYVRFNAFMPPVHNKFKDTIKSMQDTTALIIDIRGNHGGFFDVRKAMAETLVKDRVLFWRYQGRDKTSEAYLEPADSVYEGPVVVMVDHLSVSSAEEFSGGLKAINRATIIGERTPGVVVTANFEKLPNLSAHEQLCSQYAFQTFGMLGHSHKLLLLHVSKPKSVPADQFDAALQSAFEEKERLARHAYDNALSVMEILIELLMGHNMESNNLCLLPLKGNKLMGKKFCPNCGEVVLTKALSKYSQRDYKGVLVKRRQIGHLTEDGGCGHTWYTVEVPEDNLPFKNW